MSSSSSSMSTFGEDSPKPVPTLTPLIASRNPLLDHQAKQMLPQLLDQYIRRLGLEPHLDPAARESLAALNFLQAMQTLEHFSASTSSRIQKQSAYLMGILRGQESHWERAAAAHGVPGGHAQLLGLPAQVLAVIAQCSLEGNALPSDFTPEVLLSLHSLNVALAIKSISAFNSNKRIVAGARGGIVNRPRFFLRLIQNVNEQNSTNLQNFNMAPNAVQTQQQQFVGNGNNANRLKTFATSPIENTMNNNFMFENVERSNNNGRLQKQFTDSVLTLDTTSMDNSFDFGGSLGPIGSPVSSTKQSFTFDEVDISRSAARLNRRATDFETFDAENRNEILQQKVAMLENELRERQQGDAILRNELDATRNQLRNMEREYVKLRQMFMEGMSQLQMLKSRDMCTTPFSELIENRSNGSNHVKVGFRM